MPLGNLGRFLSFSSDLEKQPGQESDRESSCCYFPTQKNRKRQEEGKQRKKLKRRENKDQGIREGVQQQ